MKDDRSPLCFDIIRDVMADEADDEEAQHEVTDGTSDYQGTQKQGTT